MRICFSPGDEALASRAWAYLERVDGVFNAYREDSEIGRLNGARTIEGARVSEPLAEALIRSMEVHRLTDGAFDVTVGPLVRLWKSAAKSGVPPTEEKIMEALRSCGLDKVSLDGDVLTSSVRGIKFDFGGIVKGMAVDRVTRLLREAGSRAALVQVGGETAAFGLSRRSRPHVIGVRHPMKTNALWTAIVDPGPGLSVSTSGNYYSPIVVGEKVYYHIVDPRTGAPVDTRTLSVTVVFRETGKNWLADGLTTAAAVMGPGKAAPLVQRLGGEALFLIMEKDEEGARVRELATPGWRELVRTE